MLLFLELTNKGEAITISTSIKLPVGIENFEEIRTGGYYYVDKTKLIKQLFASGGKVNLFTRPRRFGEYYGAADSSAIIRFCFFILSDI